MQVIGRRLLSVPAVIVGVSVFTFFVLSVLPGDIAEQLLGAEATREQIEQLRAELGLSGTTWENYARWLAGLMRGDMGRSLASGVPVTTLLSDRAPVTLQLLGYAIVVALGVAFPAALFAARRPGGWVDRLCTILSMASLSIPDYVLAVLLVLVLAVKMPLFPSIGFAPLSDGLWQNIGSLTLPSLAIAFPLLGLYVQFLRGDLIEQMNGQAYVETAAAKGLGRWAVLVRHALRNSLFGLLTIVGLHIGTLIGSTVIIEQIFALPGLGQLLLHAVTTRDTVVIQGIVMMLATMTVLASLTVDLLHAALDPRIRYRVR